MYRHREAKTVAETVSVGEANRQAVSSLGIEDRLKEQSVLSIWPEVVGENFAAVTQADAIKRGELFVSVVHDAWRHRLLFERDHIREKLNRTVGGDPVRTIRFTR